MILHFSSAGLEEERVVALYYIHEMIFLLMMIFSSLRFLCIIVNEMSFLSFWQ
jgi:hypothetical protein